MAYQIRVRPGCTILAPDFTVFRGGQVIPEGVLTQKQAEEHIKSGYGEPVNLGSGPVADRLVERPPGTQQSLPLPAFDLGKKRAPEPTLRIETPAKIDATLSSKAPVKTAKSLWVLDPATLAGKDLGVLNTMVQERDPSVVPFDTVPEAVAFLSRDFEASK